MREIIRYGLFIMGLFIGGVHLKLALKALFIFRNNEPISMWVSVIAGPLSTLPSVIIAFFWPKVGGLWLICGAILSLIAITINLGANRDSPSIIWYFLRYSAPMLALGLVALLQIRK